MRSTSMDKEGAVQAVIEQQQQALDFTARGAAAPGAQDMESGNVVAGAGGHRDGGSGNDYVGSGKFSEQEPGSTDAPTWTPTGGSACQQSSRAIMATLLVVTFVLISMVCAAFEEVKVTYDDELAMLKAFAANATASNDAAELQAWVALYDDEVAAGADPKTLCDAQWFAENRTDSVGIVDTVQLLDDLMGIFFGLGATAAAVFLLVKTCTTYSLSVELNRDDENTPGDKPVLEGVVIGGDPETRAERRTRIYLRSETVAYAFAQGLLDVPLLTLCLLYYLLRSSRRGSRCAECFLDREVCATEGFGALPTSVSLALITVCVSLLWNFCSLMERWVQFIRWKRVKLRGGNIDAAAKYYVVTVILLAAYALVIVAPMALLIHFEFAPFFAQVADPEALKLLGFVGVGVWGVATFFLLFVAGLEGGEICACPLLFCEVFEVFCDPLMESCTCCEGLCCC